MDAPLELLLGVDDELLELPGPRVAASSDLDKVPQDGRLVVGESDLGLDSIETFVARVLARPAAQAASEKTVIVHLLPPN